MKVLQRISARDVGADERLDSIRQLSSCSKRIKGEGNCPVACRTSPTDALPTFFASFSPLLLSPAAYLPGGGEQISGRGLPKPSLHA